jgi:hypothetical protein
MLGCGWEIRYHIATILAAHWWEFVGQYRRWIRPVVFPAERDPASAQLPHCGARLPRVRLPQMRPLRAGAPLVQEPVLPYPAQRDKHATDLWTDQVLNRLWGLIWYAHIGASLLDPRFSVRYIGRYTKRAVLAEYRITFYDGRTVRFAFRDYAAGGRTSFATVSVNAFIGRLVRHIPGKYFPMVRYAGLFCNRWRRRYLAQAQAAMGRKESGGASVPEPVPWAERQEQLTGTNPLLCPCCHVPMVLAVVLFGPWEQIQSQPSTRVLGIPAALSGSDQNYDHAGRGAFGCRGQLARRRAYPKRSVPSSPAGSGA